MSKKVFVVDDDPVVRILVSEYLGSNGYAVEALESGPRALARLEECQPDVLVLDLMMPEMSGIEVLQQIRANPNTTRLPIVMLSADQDSHEIVASHDVSADKYIQKPFGMREILGAVQEAENER